MSSFQPTIIYQDNHLLVVNKPADMLTQPDDTGAISLLEECRQWLKTTLQKPGNVFLEAVHRLDKPVSGLVVFAKTSKALSRLNASMRAKEMVKFYHAKITGRPPQEEGRLVHYLVHGDRKAILGREGQPEAKKASLRYRVLAKAADHLTVEIILETGRYHQIRAQFSAMGCPLLGDIKYGGPAWQKPGIALSHVTIHLPHPITKELLQLSIL